MAQRAIKLVDRSRVEKEGIRLTWLVDRPYSYHGSWVLNEFGGQFFPGRLDLEKLESLAKKIVRLREDIAKAQSELAQSRKGLRSFFTSEDRRHDLENQVVALERELSGALEEFAQVGLTEEQGSYHIELGIKSGRWGCNYFHVYMSYSGFAKAEAFQKEKPIYMGTKDGQIFWWHRDRFWISMGYSEKEARLLLWEKGRREQKKIERLAKAMAAAEEVREEAGRERIPEEVRLLVWERDGGCCVKCGSTEDLEFDHIIPVSKGGSNTEKNVQLLCATCNREKRDHIA